MAFPDGTTTKGTNLMKRKLSLALLTSLTVAALAACSSGGAGGGSTTGGAPSAGTSATAGSPGKAYDEANDPCRTATCPDYFGHVYTRTGTMTVTLQVSWNASYSLDGTAFQPVDDAPITGPASTVHVEVRQARGVLVLPPGD